VGTAKRGEQDCDCVGQIALGALRLITGVLHSEQRRSGAASGLESGHHGGQRNPREDGSCVWTDSAQAKELVRIGRMELSESV